ncbi:MAG: pseudouridine synthase [Rhodospirillales bacterium]|nr:pseudouridine synthase [Rhodospirillales bacterium]
MTAERIGRRIARSGLCSRRTAERWIAAGRVHVNGAPVFLPGRNVVAEDTVTVDGTVLPAPAPARLFRFHKPPGFVTTRADPAGRQTVFDLLPDGLPYLHPVGRLDLASEGLLLLTTDGALKRRLELPRTGLPRHYRVRVHGRIDPNRLAALARGTQVDGVRYGPIAVEVARGGRTNAWLEVTLREGKNREVRRVLQHVGLLVNRLIRTAYGPIQLGSLPRGGFVEVPAAALHEHFGSSR